MAIELHVLSDRRLDSIAEWQNAIDDRGYPLRLSTDAALETVNGFLPAMLSGRQTGFECFHDDATQTMEFLGRSHFDHPWAFALGFRWRGDFDELEAAWMAATAYAAASDGMIFDPEAGKPLTPVQARDVVGGILRDRPQAEARMEQIKRKLGR